MNAEQLAALGRNALAWSKAYVTLKEALVSQGVQPAEAERVARDTVNLVGLWSSERGEPCPLCGRSG
jgi:hypothetical protein